MFRSILDWFSPVPSDKDTAAARRMLIGVLIVTIAASIAGYFSISNTISQIVVITLTALQIVSLILAFRNILAPARFIVPAAATTALIFFTLRGNGFYDVAKIGLSAVIVLAGLLLGEWGAIAFGVFIAGFAVAVGFSELSGSFTPLQTSINNSDITVAAVFYLALTGVLIFLLRRFNQLLAEARAGEQSQANTARELLELKDKLEKRVQERTLELEKVNRQNLRRAAQFESIAQTSRAMASLQSLNELLPHMAQLISKQFDFYHVGVFLLDEVGEYAVLVAANSAGGVRMIERGHKLKVGQVGIVGYAAASGSPRIALDTGQDAIYFDNPDLPETHSEMALPLKVGSRVIGVLDVQSKESGAFTNEDVASLSILADQVSIAIENTRQYEATLQSLAQTEATYRQYVKTEWQRLMQEENLAGYRYVTGSSNRLEHPVDLGHITPVVAEGRIYQSEAAEAGDGLAELAVPVKLRGEVIGVLNLTAANKKRWNDDDIDIVEAVAERLALSIENARLFQVSNKRAERERVVSEIASKISGNIRIENLLRSAAQELSLAMNGSEVLIQIQTEKHVGGAS